MDGFQKPRGATDVPEEFIHGEAIRRRRILIGELPRLPVERNAASLRLVEHADAELASRSGAWEPVERTLGGMGFPRIDLPVRLCHLRKHPEQPPQEHILALLQPLLDVIAGVPHIQYIETKRFTFRTNLMLAQYSTNNGLYC